MADGDRIVIPWQPSDEGGPLGSNIWHDPRNRAFPVTVPAEAVPLRTVLWRRRIAVLDQGQIGCCVPNAAVGARGTNPNPVYRGKLRLAEPLCLSLYGRATQTDPFAGTWPPDDTGTDPVSVCKVMVEAGLITSYSWAFGIDQALQALQKGPILIGINWHEGFDRPDPRNGFVEPVGQVRGRHEIVLQDYLMHGSTPDLNEDLVGGTNSWGPGWGLRGRLFMRVASLDRLLHEGGDVTQLAA